MANHGWDYGNNFPPQLWHLLEGSKANGRRQSPIAIDPAIAVKSAPPLPAFRYKPVGLSDFVFSASHLEVEASTPSAGGHIEHNGKKYAFKNFHLHTPSEHTFNGKYSALEIHVVHTHQVTAKKSDILVLGVRVEVGNANAELEKLIKVIKDGMVRHKPAHFAKAIARGTITPDSLYPKKRAYYYYEGSLTTPPCTEGVLFFLFDTPIESSQEQLDEFSVFAPGGNNRPIQALNGRKIWRG